MCIRDSYHDFDLMRDEKYDGMIITGAPVEQMPYEDVNYWDAVSYTHLDVYKRQKQHMPNYGKELNVQETTVYKPEYSWNYEVGSHLSLFNGKLKTLL